MDEYLEVLIKLLEGRSVNFSGKFYKIRDFKLEPPLIQKPRPQIWIGAWKRKAIERAAKFGDRWFPGQVADFKYLIKAREMYIEFLNKFKKKFKGFSLIREAYVATSEEQALNDVKESVIHMYGVDYASSNHPILRASNIDDFIRDRFLVGPRHK